MSIWDLRISTSETGLFVLKIVSVKVTGSFNSFAMVR